MKYILKPARYIYKPVLYLVMWPIKLIFNLKIKYEPGVTELKGPLIVLGNHPSSFDPVYMALALPHLMLHFVTSSTFFRVKVFGRFLELIGAIPKVQFRADGSAIKKMLTVVRNKGALAIFPEGQRSADGVNCPMDEAIGRLVKKAGCHTLLVKSKGAYIAWPRWSQSGIRRGRIDLEVSLLFSPQDLKESTAEEVTGAIHQALSFDDYSWLRQQEEPIKWLNFKPAAGLHQVLHYCPACQEMMAMLSGSRKLSCQHCSASWLYDRYGFLQKEGSRQAASDVYLWHQDQLAATQRMLNQQGFSLEIDVTTEIAGLDGAFESYGSGRISAGQEGFSYQGKDQQGQTVSHKKALGQLSRLSANLGRNLEIPFDSGSFRFTPRDGQEVILLKDSLTLLDKMVKAQ